MPGYVIHIAIAQEYLRKKGKEYNEDFIKGSVYPDLTNKKFETHYGKSPAFTNLKEFILKNEINTQLNKGKFLHLITDYLFYNYYLEKMSKEHIYNDYDISNKNLIERYNVKLIKEIQDAVNFKDGEMQLLTYSLLYKMIDEISDLDLDKVKLEALNNDKKWNTYKNLI